MKEKDNCTISNSRVFVTGGAGFIGACLCRKLVKDGNEVVVLDHPEASLERIKEIKTAIKVIHEDLANVDLSTLQNTFQKPDYVFHLASAGVNQGETNIARMIETNVSGSYKVAELSKFWEVKRLVYCGSCFEYGSGSGIVEKSPPNPISEYGATKTAAWYITNTYAKRHGLKVTSVRPFNVYGIGESYYRLVPHVIAKALAGERIETTLGEQSRDFICVDDVVDGLCAAARSPGSIGGTFNLCTGIETTVKCLVEMIVGIVNPGAEVDFGAIPYRYDEIWNLSGSPKAAQDVLGWTANTELEDGLRKTIEWTRTNIELEKTNDWI
ncbi:MAG: SDR family NAD(P)-dependent oxidoreductase [Planctomycetota bacterium]